MDKLKNRRKRITRVIICTILLLASANFYSPNCFAQQSFQKEQDNFQTLSNFATEKVHLHIDRSIFSPGEDIWFKAYLLDGANHNPTSSSHNLHVELISPSGIITDTLTIFLNEDIGKGDFHLDKEKYKEGTYQIRAYTHFMRNFGSDLFFTKNILIKAFIENAKQPERMVERGIELRFFPEGGNLAQKINNKIAFKATNKSGKSVAVKLLLFDGDDKLLQTTNSIHNGMGLFNLIPEPGNSYYALVDSVDLKQEKTYLPEAIPGYSIWVGDQFNHHLSFQVNTSPEKVKRQKLKFTIQSRGILALKNEVVINDTQNIIRIDKTQLPEGILCITLYDENDIPVCERLVFNQLFKKVNIKINTDKSEYLPKEKVNLSITTKDENGNPVPANLSLAVVDQFINQTEKKLEIQSEGIVSSILLNADLRGNIENPEFYFQDFDIKKHFKLDLLLLTHGWRKYVWKEVVKQDSLQLDFDYEQGFTFSGTATNLLFNKPLSNTKVSLSMINDGVFFQDNLTDENGDFRFDNIYALDTSIVIIQAYDKRDKRKTNIELDLFDYQFPKIDRIEKALKYYTLPQLNDFAKQTEIINRLKDSLEIKNHIDIEEVTVTAKQKKINDGHFRIYDKPNFALDLKEIQNSESYPDIFALLRRYAPDVIIRGSCGTGVKVDFHKNQGKARMGAIVSLSTGRTIAPDGTVKYLLDGFPFHGNLCNIIPSSVDKIELLWDTKAAAAIGDSKVIGIVAVYRKKGWDQWGSTFNVGIKRTKVRGYYRAREFFSPDYDKPQEGFTGLDIRNTLFWEPLLVTGEDGKANVSFFNGDKTTAYNINVEGVGIDGGIGESKEDYKVVSKEFLLNILPLSSKTQNNSYANSSASLAEKAYLQLDGNVFTSGNTVWFKCIVSNAIDHIPSTKSGVLYAELISQDEKVLEKKLIKIDNGIGQGSFSLGQNLPEGVYKIRAYTEWNRNFDKDFFFEEYIHLYAPENEKVEDAISDVQLIKENNNVHHLKACFNPFIVDTLHKKKLKVYITFDGETDSLFLKKDRDKKYRIDYSTPNDYRFVKLEMQTDNHTSYSKTILLNEDYFDLQFFPESGELVHGLPGKVGFKALDATGKGKQIEGDILHERDSIVTSFKSNSIGMGSFILTEVDSTKKYFAQLKSQMEENEFLIFSLPDVASKGNVLSILKEQNNICLTAFSNYMKNDSISLQISCRGMELYSKKVRLSGGAFKLTVPISRLPEGILSFTMRDNSLQTVAERLYFNERPETRLNINIFTPKKSYTKRELTKLNIKTTALDGEPASANLSVLVINKKQLGEMQDTRKNILSHFLLESELRGAIENPGFYFQTDSALHEHLDALMLTQGWRKYHYAKPYNKFTFQPEQTLSVSGNVSGVFSKKMKGTAELTLLTIGKNKSFFTQTTDSLGKFKFNLNDEYGENMDIVIKSANESGKNMNYTLELNKTESPAVAFNHLKTVAKLDSVVNQFVEKNIERKKIDDAFPLTTTDVVLEEVTKVGYRLTPQRIKVMKKYGKPTEVIEGNEIVAKEENWSFGLYSVLKFNFPDKIKIVTTRRGLLRAEVIDTEHTLIVIDGRPIKRYEYDRVQHIPPATVSSFEVIRGVKNYRSLYYEAMNEDLPKEIQFGGVVAIYTHAQNGLEGVSEPKGIVNATVPVFSEPAEFYAPKYENLKADDWNKPDLRALVHWQPLLKTDNKGTASTTFYNADNVGEMLVVVEAIAANGEIGYKEIITKVEGKEEEIVIVD